MVTQHDDANTCSEMNHEELTHSTQTVTPPLRRSQRETRMPDCYGVYVNSACAIREPTTVSEALSCDEKENWRKAMKAEYKSLEANHVWDLVPLPKD